MASTGVNLVVMAWLLTQEHLRYQIEHVLDLGIFVYLARTTLLESLRAVLSSV